MEFIQVIHRRSWRFLPIGIASMTLAACGGSQQQTDPTVTSRPAVVRKAPPVKLEAKVLFQKGVKAYRGGKAGGNEKQAISYFKGAVDTQPAFGQAYFNIGLIHEDKGRLSEAERWYRLASEKGVGFGDGYANLGRIRLSQGRTEEGMDLFREAIRVDKYNGEAHLNLAQDARRRKDWVAAIKHVRTSLTENNQNIKAYEVLAWIYYDLPRYELAKLVCLRGLEIDDKYSNLHNLLGLVHLKLNDVRAALGAFEQAVEYDPNHVAAHLNIGAITFNYRNYEESLRHFEAAVRVEPKNVTALLSRAVALRGLDRIKEAEQGYRDVLRLNENHVGAHYNLGILYQQYLNRLPDAVETFQKVLSLETRDGKLRKDVSQRIQAIRIQMKSMQEAAEELKKEQASKQAETQRKSAQK